MHNPLQAIIDQVCDADASLVGITVRNNYTLDDMQALQREAQAFAMEHLYKLEKCDKLGR